MLKNIAKNFRIMLGCVAVIVSPSVWAETTSIPVELRCNNNPFVDTWIVYDAQFGVRFTLVTNGLLDSKQGKVSRVFVDTKSDSLARTSDGLRLYMYVAVECISGGNANIKSDNIAQTGSLFKCNKGEGIKIKMLEPSCSDLDGCYYVGTLIRTEDEEKELDDPMPQKNILNE